MDDTSPEPPRGRRTRVAAVLLLLMWPLGWPMVAASASASPWIGVEYAAALGTLSYGTSWLMLGVGSWLGGAELMARSRGGGGWRRWLRRGR